MAGPTVGELMSDRHRNLQYDDDEDDEDEEEEEEEDDFIPRRHRESSGGEESEAPAAKRTRYSPSAPNGYANSSPSAPAPASSSQSRPPQAQATMVSARPPPSTKPTLEHSILNVEPLDEFIREVGDFVHRHLANHTENVEVEAKIGVLRDSASGQRIRIPVGVETILSPEMGGVRFESNMSVGQHRHFNTLLNNLGAEPSPSDAPRTPLKYRHTKLVDTLYAAPDGSRDKIRVTVDESGKVVQCIRKVRLGDLNVYSPKRNADWRISINLEIPTPEPTGTPLQTRKKDRLTYTHQYCNIDLTQVKQSASASSTPTVLHELELELHPSAMPVLIHSASRRNSPDPSLSQEQRDEFDDIMRIFVNNARILVRNASTGWEGP